MKYLDEFHDPDLAAGLFAEIARSVTQPWAIMEVCGGQTHSIIRNGIDQLLPEQVELIHGPGCPVCVTPLEMIDRALAIAARPDVVFCSFGDMLRVPGSTHDLFAVKARGGDVRVVYSPLDAVEIAENEPSKQVVFFGVGFETTAPANAMAVFQARRRGLDNFSMLVSHVLVPPAIEALMTLGDLAGRRVPRRRSRVHRDGHRAVRAVRGAVPRADRRHRVRTARRARRHPADRAAARRRARRGRERLSRGRCGPRATQRRGRCSTTCTRCAIGSGGASG